MVMFKNTTPRTSRGVAFLLSESLGSGTTTTAAHQAGQAEEGQRAGSGDEREEVIEGDGFARAEVEMHHDADVVDREVALEERDVGHAAVGGGRAIGAADEEAGVEQGGFIHA